MQNQISISKISADLWFLGVLFYPLKFFTFKLNTFDLSFFKVIVILLFIIDLLHLSVNRKLKIRKSFGLFLFLVFLSLINQSFERRVLMNCLSYSFIVYFSFFGVSLLNNFPSKKVLKKTKIVFKFWVFFIFLGYVQLFLSVLGYNYSWESIGEKSIENVGIIFGKLILRPNSLFGEPRSFSSVLIFVGYTYNILLNKSPNLFRLIPYVILGIFTQSSTFLLVLITSLIFIQKRSISSALALSFFGLVAFSLLPYLSVVAPRMLNVADFSISNLQDLRYAEQAGDFSFFVYLREAPLLELLFGHGFGLSSHIIADMVHMYFPQKSDFNLINSRWIFYTLLIDVGIFGLCAIYYLVARYMPSYRLGRNVVLLCLAGGLYGNNFLFVFMVLIFRKLRYV